MRILQDFEKQISQYQGVRTEWIEGDVITLAGERRTDLKVTLPCTDGSDWGFTLQDETAVGVFMASRAHNTEHAHHDIDERILQELAGCYNKKLQLNKKEA